MDYVGIAEEIDRQMLVNLTGRIGVTGMYAAAREKLGIPLTLHAAQLLMEKMNEDSVVFIATGWADIHPSMAESDGPPGAASLARALSVAFRAVPIILVEDELIPSMKATMLAAGLFPLPPDEVLEAHEIGQKTGARYVCSVIDFPKDTQQAKKASEELIKKFSPSAVVTVEKGGMNEKGVFHNSRGFATGKYISKIDYLIDEGKRRGIPTVGIGDGGNEIGMGVIGEWIKKEIPYGAKCRCPCGSGIAPYNKTDSLIVAPISNWGAYGLEAAIALLLKRPEIMHDGAIELRVLGQAADAGFIMARWGYTDPGADGVSGKYHSYVVELLRRIVLASI